MAKPHYELKKLWLNIYPADKYMGIMAGGLYYFRRHADNIAKDNRITCLPIYVPVPSNRRVNTTRTSF